MARGAYALAKQTSAAAGFILLQAARLETAQELAATHPEQAQVILEQYNAANAAVVEGAIQICHGFAAQMQNMSHEERVEFIAEVVAEIALTKSSTKFWLAATGKALNAAGKGVRKIAQVVEAEAASKPKAVAATPEGIMLDAAEVLEAEVNPLAEAAKLQEGPAVEGRAAAQGVQAVEDAAAKAKPIIEEAHPGEPMPAVEEKPQPVLEQGPAHEVPAEVAAEGAANGTDMTQESIAGDPPIGDAHDVIQYEKLKAALQVEEFKSIVDVTEHGIQRLIERNFTPEDVIATLQNPTITKIQIDGVKVFIKKINDRYTIIAVNQTSKKIVTALRNIDEKALVNLGINHGWQ